MSNTVFGIPLVSNTWGNIAFSEGRHVADIDWESDIAEDIAASCDASFATIYSKDGKVIVSLFSW